MSVKLVVFFSPVAIRFAAEGASVLVADSVPDTEYQEVLAKSAILRRALELAKEGL